MLKFPRISFSMQNKNTTKFILILFWFCASAFCVSSQTKNADSLKWEDVRNLTIEGKGWQETKSFYDRLPAKAENVVRPSVWNLAQNSAGISARFMTDSPEISVRWKLRSTGLSLSNMPAMSVSGVDLYVKDNGRWRWAGAGKSDKFPTNEQKVIGNMIRRKREFLLYLPLYNGVESVEIGVLQNSSITKAVSFPANVKPILFYGTSIVQGASAARAGMAYPSILSRRLNLPVLNLGFSGNCKMETELADLIGEIDASVYFIDCLPNLSNGEEVEAKAPKFIEILCRKRPNTPIILVENIEYPDVFIEERKRLIYESKNKGLQNVYRNLLKSGAKRIYYIPSRNLIGDDGEATIDGVHPTDLGFMRMANVFEPVLRRALKASN